jgi:hypothetical protein
VHVGDEHQNKNTYNATMRPGPRQTAATVAPLVGSASAGSSAWGPIALPLQKQRHQIC